MSVPANAKAGASQYGCPLCQTAADSDTGYFVRAFGDRHHLAATAEAVADALGFCPRHGALLLSQDHWPEGVAHVLRDALPHLALLSNEHYLHEHLVQQVLFGADGACPACSYANRVTGRQAAALARRYPDGADGGDGLCIAHFQAIAACLAPERRLEVLTARVEFMAQAVRRVRTLLRQTREAAQWPIGNGDEILRNLLDLVIGRPQPASIQADRPDGALAEALAQSSTLEDALLLPDVCPVCVEAERSRRRWLDRVQAAAGFDDDAWLFLPTCAEHVAEIARLDQAALTMAAVARALAVALRHQRQQIHALVQAAALDQEIARIKAEGPVAWAEHKRKRARHQAELPKLPPPPRLAKCPACERAEIAVEHATGKLLDLLHERKHRDAFLRGYGLCLKHFARTYRIAPKGMVRSLLADDLRRRLAECAEASGAASRDTLHRFCGLA
jgi:hypothetical protein